jgi:CelD/BcsL family acetyltransferase involved in cellulose biosynthesis
MTSAHAANFVAAPVAAPAISVSIRRMGTIDELETTWRELERRADTDFFLTWDWIGCWLAETGGAPFVLTARAEGEIIALGLLLPARLHRHGVVNANALLLHHVGERDTDIITIEYNGFLVDRRYGAAGIRACLEFFERPQRDAPPCDELHLSGVSSDFLQLVPKDRWLVWDWAQKPSFRVDLAELRRNRTSYLDTLSANTRYQIRRSLRLYEKRGKLDVAPARDVAEAERYLEEMKELHEAYWRGRNLRGGFSYPFYERFHRALVRACIPRGTVELIKVTAGEHIIGYVYNFLHGGRSYAYMTGFRYESDPKLKPGLISHYLCIERHLAAGTDIYDFLAGDHRYKSNLGVRGPDMLFIILQRPIAILRLEHALRRCKGRAVAISQALRSIAGRTRAAPAAQAAREAAPES